MTTSMLFTRRAHRAAFRPANARQGASRQNNASGGQSRQECVVRAKQSYKLELEANESVECTVDVPEGAEVYSVALAKPIGIVLEEKGKGNILVAEVKDGSNAAQSSTKIQTGDKLLAVSGREMEGAGGKTVATEEQMEERDSLWGPAVMINTADQDFDTVMAAIQSQSGSKSKTALVFSRNK